MTRTTARAIAVQLGFSVVMTEEFAEETIDKFFEDEHYASLAGENPLYDEYPDPVQMEYIRRVVKLIFDHRIQLDAYIEKYSKGWKVGRISKTATAIMRCAICEILYMDDIPNAAAINEAVEMAKGYEDPDVVAFINGILGGFVRGELGGAAGEAVLAEIEPLEEAEAIEEPECETAEEAEPEAVESEIAEDAEPEAPENDEPETAGSQEE